MEYLHIWSLLRYLEDPQESDEESGFEIPACLLESVRPTASSSTKNSRSHERHPSKYDDKPAAGSRKAPIDLTEDDDFGAEAVALALKTKCLSCLRHPRESDQLTNSCNHELMCILCITDDIKRQIGEVCVARVKCPIQACKQVLSDTKVGQLMDGVYWERYVHI